MGLKNKDLNQNKSQLFPQFSCSSWLSEALNEQCWAVAEAGTICSGGDTGLEQRPAGLRSSTPHRAVLKAESHLKTKKKNDKKKGKRLDICKAKGSRCQ